MLRIDAKEGDPFLCASQPQKVGSLKLPLGLSLSLNLSQVWHSDPDKVRRAERDGGISIDERACLGRIGRLFLVW